MKQSKQILLKRFKRLSLAEVKKSPPSRIPQKISVSIFFSLNSLIDGEVQGISLNHLRSNPVDLSTSLSEQWRQKLIIDSFYFDCSHS